MEAIVTCAIWFFIIFSIVRKFKRKSNGKINNGQYAKKVERQITSINMNQMQSENSTSMPANPVNTAQYSGHARSTVRNTGALQLKDDREHDWLHRQLQEEHQAFKRTSAMFDLKHEHAASCDARRNAIYHQQNCDAHGIDTGEK